MQFIPCPKCEKLYVSYNLPNHEKHCKHTSLHSKQTQTVLKPPQNEDCAMNDSDNITSSSEQQAEATDDMPVEGTQAESTANENMNNRNDISSSDEQEVDETDDMPKENHSKKTDIKERCPTCKRHLIQLEIIIFILA